MAGSKEDTETGAFFQEHAGAGSATPLLVVSDGAASTAPSRSNRRGGPLLLAASGLGSFLAALESIIARGRMIALNKEVADLTSRVNQLESAEQRRASCWIDVFCRFLSPATGIARLPLGQTADTCRVH
jgi:hypothetical protein